MIKDEMDSPSPAPNTTSNIGRNSAGSMGTAADVDDTMDLSNKVILMCYLPRSFRDGQGPRKEEVKGTLQRDWGYRTRWMYVRTCLT